MSEITMFIEFIFIYTKNLTNKRKIHSFLGKLTAALIVSLLFNPNAQKLCNRDACHHQLCYNSTHLMQF